MKNPQNFVIVLLTITAAILLGVLLGAWQDRTAQAGYASVSKGDYIMVPYNFGNNWDLICVIDTGTKKMKIYSPDLTTKGLVASPDVDLDRVFSSSP